MLSENDNELILNHSKKIVNQFFDRVEIELEKISKFGVGLSAGSIVFLINPPQNLDIKIFYILGIILLLLSLMFWALCVMLLYINKLKNNLNLETVNLLSPLINSLDYKNNKEVFLKILAYTNIMYNVSSNGKLNQDLIKSSGSKLKIIPEELKQKFSEIDVQAYEFAMDKFEKTKFVRLALIFSVISSAIYLTGFALIIIQFAKFFFYKI